MNAEPRPGHVSLEKLTDAVIRAEKRLEAQLPGDGERALLVLKQVRTRLENAEATT